LRGPLFESWVVSEIRKHRMNQGDATGLSFYRDRDGAEADLVLEHTDRLTLVEAKASATPSPGLFAGTRRVRGHLESGTRPCEVLVAYGGDEAQRRTDGELVPWNRLHERAWGR
jgi:predicted AAA+ superfamily ATPase